MSLINYNIIKFIYKIIRKTVYWLNNLDICCDFKFAKNILFNYFFPLLNLLHIHVAEQKQQEQS